MVTDFQLQKFNNYLFLKAEFDACKENPCMNGATCLQDGTFSYKCLCPLGYFGQNCTTSKKNKI